MNYTNLSLVVQCGLGFLVLFSAYNPAINLQATIMDQSGFGQLGFYNLSMISVVMAVLTPATPFMLKRLGGSARAMAIGAICCTLFILSSVLPVTQSENKDSKISDGAIYSGMMITSVFCGLGQAFLWTGSGFFLS